ncbi:MAG: WbqC family protein [Bacteroidales bacterium]
MTQAVFSMAYLPPLEYFTALLTYQEIFLEVSENYQKQTYRNRCRISGPNCIQELIIPVDKMGFAKILSRDIKISYTEPWQKIHWRSIQTAYNNSPYFLYYQDEFEPFYQKKTIFLLDFNLGLMSLLNQWLNTSVVLHPTESYIPEMSIQNDYRNRIHPKKETFCIYKPYTQVFHEKFGFIYGLSIIDLIFNEGPGSLEVIKKNQILY